MPPAVTPADVDPDAIVFAADVPEPHPQAPKSPWKILIVDDDLEVHKVTLLALGGFTFDGRPLTFVQATSAAEARRAIAQHGDTAVIMLDVVMEDDHAGLNFVRWLRGEHLNRMVRIILRTGHPGAAPEGRVIVDYDINDYRAKTELTSQRLFAAVVTALRSYRDLQALESSRSDLERTTTAYARFMPFDFLKLLGRRDVTEVDRGDNVALTMTVLFADIRDFTAASERRSPEQNFRFINRYLEHMEGAVSVRRGFINQYYGDGIMALFPASDDAVAAALDMLARLERFNAELTAKGEAPIRIGIGVNTGPLLLGTLGWERLECGVIGDAVNVAARVDGMTKVYGAPLLVAATSLGMLEHPEAFVFREIDQVVPVGRTLPVTLFEPLEGPAASKRATQPLFASALALYRAGEFARAREGFMACVAAVPEDETARRFAARCKELEASGFPGDWDGITRLSTK